MWHTDQFVFKGCILLIKISQETHSGEQDIVTRFWAVD